MNAKYEGKTAVHVAVEEGHLNSLRTLLEFRANLELEVSQGSYRANSVYLGRNWPARRQPNAYIEAFSIQRLWRYLREGFELMRYQIDFAMDFRTITWSSGFGYSL